MKTGPLEPVSSEAMTAISGVAKILSKVPKKEWQFVCKQAREKTDQEQLNKLLEHLGRLYR